MAAVSPALPPPITIKSKDDDDVDDDDEFVILFSSGADEKEDDEDFCGEIMVPVIVPSLLWCVGDVRNSAVVTVTERRCRVATSTRIQQHQQKNPEKEVELCMSIACYDAIEYATNATFDNIGI